MPIEFEEVVGQIESDARRAVQEVKTEKSQAQKLERAIRETLAREDWRAARLTAD